MGLRNFRKPILFDFSTYHTSRKLGDDSILCLLALEMEERREKSIGDGTAGWREKSIGDGRENNLADVKWSGDEKKVSEME